MTSIAQEAAPAPPRPRTRARTWGHRPALDGLRVVAVYLVVAYHGGLGIAEGGFLGVDLFFVLSGFLVTNVLLHEQATRHRIRLVRFYARRVRRLLPAAAVTIALTAVAFTYVAPPAERGEVLGGARSAFLYVANWHFLGQSNDYFAAEDAPSPFLHFWSLAIEEQFYIAFPLVMIGLIALARRAGRRPEVMVAGLASIGLLSLASQVVSARQSELRAYYATDARLFQLLAGATLAVLLWFWPHLRERWGGPKVTWLCLGGLLLCASSVWSPSASVRGIAATAIAVALLGALEAHREQGASTVLRRPVMQYLGRISYGTYLWHWPVVVLASRVLDLSPVPMTALAALVGTALAALSHEVLELPVRTSGRLDHRPRRVLALGLAVSVAGAVLVAPLVLGSDRPTAVAAGAVQVAEDRDGEVPPDLAWEAARDDTPLEPVCLGAPASDCIVVPAAGRPSVHLVGDSHAKTLLPLFERLATERGLQFSATVSGACPWQRGLLYRDNEERTERCTAMQPDWYDRVIPELDPDVVVLFHRALDDPAFPRNMTSADPELAGLAQRDLQRVAAERTIAELTSEGRRVVVIEPLPLTGGQDPTLCLSGAVRFSDCAFVASPGGRPAESVYRYLDQTSEQVWSLDIDRLVCPELPVCLPVVDGHVVRRDRHHLTGAFARELAGEVGRLFDELGVLDGL